ncbi:beta strand repeat-containing protein [Aquirufa antheringensis]
MKKLLLLVLLFISVVANAQKGISYQAVVLDPASIELPGSDITGQPLVNGNVFVKFVIISGTNIQFEEVQQTKTDAYGLVNLTIGSVASTAFNAMSWDANQKSLQVYVSFDNGASYTKVSDQKLTYSPYALFAETAGKLSTTLGITGGGTGATTAVGARANLGLGNVDNTADADKPISAATQTALNLKANVADVNAALDLKASAAMLAAHMAITVDTSMLATKAALTDLNDYAPINSPTFMGTVSGITKSMVGLGLVDNTTDAAKPISTASQAALDLKASVASVNLKAPLASPSLTGTPSAPTASPGTNSAQIATTAFVQSSIASNTLSLGSANATPNTNGATLASNILKLSPADGTNSGIVNTFDQTFGGIKIFKDGAAKQIIATNAVLDQSNTTSANQAGWTNQWQSFTAGTTGVLSSIEWKMGTPTLPYGTAANVTIKLYEGEGIDGTLLTTVNGLTPANGSNIFINFPLTNIIVTAGAKYTMLLTTPTVNVSWLDVNISNSYGRGKGSNDPNWDYIFKTNVKAISSEPYITANNSGVITASSFVKSGGTSSEYLMADGSVSSGGGSSLVNVGNSVTGLLSVSNGGTGVSTLSSLKTNLALDNVNNTTDAAKPISNATQTALDLKSPLASPAFTGVPLAPTAALGSNTTQLATTAYVQNALLNSSVSTALNGAIWTSATSGSLNGVAFTIALTSSVPSIGSPSSWVTTQTQANYSTGYYSSGTLSSTQSAILAPSGSSWRVTFASPIPNLKLYVYWRSSGIGGSTLYQFDQAFSILSGSNGLTKTSNTLNITNWGQGILEFTSPVTTLNLTADGTSCCSSQSMTFASGGTIPISGTGEVIRTASPTLITPNLGTPSTVNLTNGTGLPLSSGITGVLSIANGGTGTSTQNFVDLTSTQSITGAKTFNSNLRVNGMTIGTITYPNTAGTNGYYLKTDGTGTASWAAISGGSSSQWTTATNDIYFNTGNVGIGVSSPGSGFNTNFDLQGRASFRTNGANSGMIFDGYSPSGSLQVARIYTDATSGTPSDFVLGTYPNGHMKQLFLKQSNGYVGVNNDNPTAQLDVEGNLKTSGTITAGAGGSTIAGSLVVGGTSATGTSAALEVKSTTQGLLLPRLTTAQRDAIVNPIEGLVLFNTSIGKFQGYTSNASSAVFSNTSYNGGGSYVGLGHFDMGFGSNPMLAINDDGQSFSVPSSYSMNSIAVRFESVNYTSDITLSVYSGNIGSGILLGSVTNSVSTTGEKTFTFSSPIKLTTGNYYFQVHGSLTTNSGLNYSSSPFGSGSFFQTQQINGGNVSYNINGNESLYFIMNFSIPGWVDLN